MHLDIYGKGHFTVIPLYKFSSDNVVERREKEKHFIQIPKPSLNSDIAKNYYLSVFILLNYAITWTF